MHAIAAWAHAHLPKKFQTERLPYLLVLVWVLMGTLVLLAPLTSYPNGALISWMFAAVLLVLQGLFLCGMSLAVVVNLGVLLGVVTVAYTAWLSGGIYSPRMAWMLVIPLIPFYVLHRTTGFVWWLVVVCVECLMAYLTWRGGLPEPVTEGPLYLVSSLASYTVVMLVLTTVSVLYNHLMRQAHDASVQRHAALEEKRQQLLRASAARDQFMAMVSHELRTPMNAILGFNDMLSKRVSDQAQTLKILNHTRQSADHLLTVIHDVLDDSQLQAGQIHVHNETFALRDTVQAAFNLFAQRVESMQLQYRCVIDDNVPQWVNADRHRLMQVLVNLLGNAIKFTHQGHVTLRVRVQPLCVHFSVHDSGIGIPEAQQSKIFERFTQADRDIYTRYGGNGLGLSISQRLVALMGGHIGFESQADVGSVFWFTLPLVAVVPPQVSMPVAPTLAVSTDAALRFLVVDDHDINRLLVRQILTNHWKNCVLVEVDGGLAALEALRQQVFDLVLMDMVMPGMDGIDTTTALRLHADVASRDVPILGLTANVNPYDLERFTRAGVDAVVLKPFDADKLCAHVAQLLTEKKSSPGS